MALTKALGGGGGGGSSLTVKDEGSTLSAAVTSLDLVGAGVTATGTTAVTATIPGLPANHPDIPPASPTLFSGVAYDLEFASLGAHGGTVLGSPGTAPSIVDGALRIVGGTSASFDIKGVEWTCPGSAFTLTAKLRRKISRLQYHLMSVRLRAGASGAGNFAGLGYYANGTYQAGQVALERYTSLTARASLSTAYDYPVFIPWYVKYVYNGTNISYQMSTDGKPDSFREFSTETAVTSIGAAPARFMVGCDSLNATEAGVLYVEWIRFST